jgi:hypothetical protein
MMISILHSVKSDQLPKGTLVQLRGSTWLAELIDGHQKRPTRLAKVYGDYTEYGSIYAAEIAAAQINGKWIPVETAPKHAQTYDRAQAAFNALRY